MVMLGVRRPWEGVLLCRDGGGAKGFLKAGGFCWGVVLWRGGGTVEPGMPLTRRDADGTREARLDFFTSGAFVFGLGAVAVEVVFEGTREARLDFFTSGAFVFGLGVVAVEAVCEGTREILEGFRCTVDVEAGAGALTGAGVCESACAGCAGRDMEATDGFLRNWLLDAGERNWGWLPEGLSTGRREDAGLGMPEGRGIFEGESMTTTPTVSVLDVAIHAHLGAGNMSPKDWVSPYWHNFQRRRRTDRVAVFASGRCCRCLGDGAVRSCGDDAQHHHSTSYHQARPSSAPLCLLPASSFAHYHCHCCTSLCCANDSRRAPWSHNSRDTPPQHAPRTRSPDSSWAACSTPTLTSNTPVPSH